MKINVVLSVFITLFTVGSAFGKLNLDETTFIVPNNDGEAKVIGEILAELKAPDVRISKQGWGATLEKEPEESFRDLRNHVVVVEMPSPAREEALRDLGHTLLIIDHHKYFELDRSHPESSLEQIAELLEYKLNRFQMSVAINDRSYIYGLLESDLKFTLEEVKNVREFDLKAQGYTDEEIRENKSAYERRQVQQGYTMVNAQTTRVSLIADLYALESPLEVRNLLIVSEDLQKNPMEMNFYGSPELCDELQKNFKGWSGGSGTSKYWGNDKDIDRAEIEKFVRKHFESVRQQETVR